LTNPYEPPRSDRSVDPHPSIVRRALRHTAYGFGGAFVGYVLLVIFANLESWQFYTIRSAITGESAMSRITMHPADPWIKLGLFVAFIGGGIAAGIWLARRRGGTLRPGGTGE
jgi:hypothetical protein